MDALLPTLGSMLLHLLRVSCALIVMPPLGQGRRPRLVLAGLFLYVGFVLACVRPAPALPGGLGLLVASVAEVGLGLLLGFALRLALLPVEIAGEFLSQEAALAMPGTLDPMQGAPATAINAILRSVGTLGFLAVGGLESGIALLGRSFVLVPAGDAGRALWSPEAGYLIPGVFLRAFQATFELALPVIAASLLATSSIAVLARAVPRLNLFTDVFPIRTATVIVGLLVFLPFTVRGVSQVLDLVTGPAASAVLAR
ncbi:MAG: flagellar biosynthetic protein FliR [Planctomycetota bacterium]